MGLWEVLAALRAQPLIAAPEGDAPIDGADAVDELAAIRELLDMAVAAQPAEGAGS